MECSNIQLISQPDFDCIGQVAIHCDNVKLCIAINEAQDFDMSSLYCSFWEDIIDIWQEVEAYQEDPELPVPDNYDEKLLLICGGYYTGCNGRKRQSLGVKRALVYYAYARYLIINQSTDTATGTKIKTNDFSMPVPLKEIEMMADRYRTMGYESYKKTVDYLCINRELFTNFNTKECKGCGCGYDDCGETKAKGYGIKTSVIYKKL